MFDQRYFGSGVQSPKVYLIHERTHQKDAAAGRSEQILWRQRIWNRLRIEPLALICNLDSESGIRNLKRRNNSFCRIVLIAMDHRIGSRFAGNHAQMCRDIVGKSRGPRVLLRRLLNRFDAGDGGLERKTCAACSAFCQLCPFREGCAGVDSNTEKARAGSVVRMTLKVKTQRLQGLPL